VGSSQRASRKERESQRRLDSWARPCPDSSRLLGGLGPCASHLTTLRCSACSFQLGMSGLRSCACHLATLQCSCLCLQWCLLFGCSRFGGLAAYGTVTVIRHQQPALLLLVLQDLPLKFRPTSACSLPFLDLCCSWGRHGMRALYSGPVACTRRVQDRTCQTCPSRLAHCAGKHSHCTAAQCGTNHRHIPFPSCALRRPK